VGKGYTLAIEWEAVRAKGPVWGILRRVNKPSGIDLQSFSPHSDDCIIVHRTLSLLILG